MRPKHKQFEKQYASIFSDKSVVEAYRYRPPYPLETFKTLLELIPGKPSLCAVLDAGCGPGMIARQLVHKVDRVDAVDTSARMLVLGKELPEGDNPKLRWIHSSIEKASLQPPYALIVTAASLHWMHWETVMARFQNMLLPDAYLAVVENMTSPVPWSNELGFISQYSMNKDFAPYTIHTVTQELVERGLFEIQGMKMTKPVAFRQSIDEYIESFHARNGLSRNRMDPNAAAEFDSKLHALLSRYCPHKNVDMQIQARVIWGNPKGKTQ